MWLSRLRSWLVSMRILVRSLASLSRLRIWRCKLRHESQMLLGSGTAMVSTGSGSSNLIPHLGTSICHGYSPKKKKKKNSSNNNGNKRDIKIIGRWVCRKNSGGGRIPPCQCKEMKGIKMRSLNLTKKIFGNL